MNRKSNRIIKLEVLKAIARKEYELSQEQDYMSFEFKNYQYQFDRVIKFLGFDPDDLNNIRYYGSELNAFEELRK